MFSGFYMRKWVVALATEVTLETLTSLYATVYMRAWYRIMGATIGKGAEISTNLAGRYDLTEIGAKNFIADEVVLGDEDVRRGWMYLETVKTEDRVFVGNDAVVPPGAVIPEGALIGIKSKPPANALMAPGDTWFGSPAIKLPTRQKVDIGSNWTYEPSTLKKIWRAVFEALHTSFPSMLFITFAILSIDNFFYPAVQTRDWPMLAASFVAASVVIPLLQTFIVVAVKWLTMGIYAPDHEADVVLVGDAHRGRRRALLGARRQGAARAPPGHAVPALVPAPVRRPDGQGHLHEHDRHHRVRLRRGRRFLHRSTRSPPCRRISTRTGS